MPRGVRPPLYAPRGRAWKEAERKRIDDATGDWMIRPFPDDAKDALGRTKAERDRDAARDLTADWWRSTVADLDRAARERGEALSKGADAALRSQARVFGALGVPTDVAAALMGMTEAKFIAQHSGDYGVGDAAMIGQVSANLLRIATSTNDRYAVKAAVEVMNRRGGEKWRPPAQKIEVSRPQPKNLIDSSRLTAEERESLRAIILAASEREQREAIEHEEREDE